MSDMTIANEIRRQLGPQTFALLGAFQLAGGSNYLQFKIRGCNRINFVKITLDPSDTYTVEFWYIGRMAANVRKVAEVDQVYCDQLHDVIENKTGLFTTFHAR